MSLPGPGPEPPHSETFGQDASFHLEQPIGSMTISPSGRDVALASKEGLHIIDLDSPYSLPRYLAHRTPWEVADVQWSPFAARDYWIVSTSNQKAMVWNLEAKSWQSTIQYVLHAHTRAITDINFSAHDPDMLATCAVDSFVHCWDLRTHLRPAVSFSDWFAGATQVKWNRKDEHVLASSHDKFLHIWDKRKGAHPVRTIEAHGTKIYGVDWNRFEPQKVVTCSLDRTVKFWNTEKEGDLPDRIINTPFPVWRARHTPFGWGMIAMPQRGSGDLFLYDRRHLGGFSENGQDKPVARFTGHSGQVKEFLWRIRGTPVDNIDHREFQLISWGTDRELRLHRIDTEAMEGIGYEKGVSKTHRLNLTRRGARYKSFRELPDESSSPIDPLPQSESLSSQHQIGHFRKRTSTTVGMSKIPLSQVRGWGSRDQRPTRVTMHGRGNNTNEMNPISWLKNVRIASWDPDALAEEIRQVGEKFKKVEFETVDVKHRKLVMSLQAPWSEHHHAVYLRVDMRFPKTYPREANAIISVQKTGNLEGDLHATLSKELHAIAEVYASQKRGCLEAVLRYLLREQSLEQIVTWVMGESGADSKILMPGPMPEDESSDSDDDNLQGLGNPLAASANIRVPLAKGCGALWAENGRLMCFFPPKNSESGSIFGTLSLHNIERAESSRLFEGFGRIHAGSSARKPTTGTRITDDGSDSDTSDSLLGSPSSSSSSSSEAGTDLQDSILPYHKSGSGLALQQSRSIDHSNRSTTMAGFKVAEGPRRSVLSLQSYTDLLPSQKDLAENYKIFGSGHDICIHNARTAVTFGREDLFSVWNLAAMILRKSVPLELLDDSLMGSREHIVVIARRASSQLKKKDSGIGLRYGEDENAAKKTVGQASLRWGTSPLAGRYLIPAMFDYFDRIGDIQMLAMLSCIFMNSTATAFEAANEAGGLRGMDSGKSSKVERYYASKSTAESLLRPQPTLSREIWTTRNAELPVMLSDSAERQEPHSRRATTVSLDPSGGYHYEPRSRHMSRAPSMTVDESSRSAAVSLSTSPEGNRLLTRASTSGALSHAQASLSALTQSFSHSPPAPNSITGMASSLKKYSPSSSLTPSWGIFSSGQSHRSSRPSVHYSESSSQDKETSLRSAASMANIRNLRRDGRLTPDQNRRSARSTAPPSEASDSTRRFEAHKPKKKILKTALRNQDQFDLEGYSTVPLLDPSLELMYKGYRASYAQLLEVWQLPIQRAEILKVDGLAEDETSGPSPIKRHRRRTLNYDDQIDAAGLQVRRCCQSCGEILAAVEKNGVAIGWYCIDPECAGGKKRVSKKSLCAICYRGVNGLSVPCLQCGHLTCYDCAQEWFGNRSLLYPKQRKSSKTIDIKLNGSITVAEEAVEDADDTDMEPEARTCPTGCGCPCPIVDIEVPLPRGVASNRTSLNSSLQRTASQLSRHSHSNSSSTIQESETRLPTFLALTRKHSSFKTEPVTVTDSSPPKLSTGADEEYDIIDGTQDSDVRNVDGDGGDKDRLLNPWAGSAFASLGRGIGGGLSRGLKERGSDSTIRRVER